MHSMQGCRQWMPPGHKHGQNPMSRMSDSRQTRSVSAMNLCLLLRPCLAKQLTGWRSPQPPVQQDTRLNSRENAAPMAPSKGCSGVGMASAQSGPTPPHSGHAAHAVLMAKKTAWMPGGRTLSGRLQGLSGGCTNMARLCPNHLPCSGQSGGDSGRNGMTT